MPTLFELRAIADRARASVADAAPANRGNYRGTQVSIRTLQWSGRVGGEGDFSEQTLVLPKRYRVRQIETRELIWSNGAYDFQDLRLSGIAPPYPGGGYTLAQLDPTTALDETSPPTQVEYILCGDVTGLFGLVNLDTSRQANWGMILRTIRTGA